MPDARFFYQMKVILSRDVPNVGKQGDVATVAEGFGRNYLIPRRMAVEATPGNLKNIERQHALEDRLKEKRVAVAQQAAGKIDGAKITLHGHVGTGTKLYGSITAQHIADAVKEQLGVDLDKRKLHLDKPIRSLGTFEVPIGLHREVTSKITVEVVAEETGEASA